MKINTRNLLIITILMLIAIAAVPSPVMAAQATKPLWAQDRTINAASPICAYNRGVYRIRPNSQGNYWLTCNDGYMVRVKIKVTKATDTVAIAAL